MLLADETQVPTFDQVFPEARCAPRAIATGHTPEQLHPEHAGNRRKATLLLLAGGAGIALVFGGVGVLASFAENDGVLLLLFQVAVWMLVAAVPLTIIGGGIFAIRYNARLRHKYREEFSPDSVREWGAETGFRPLQDRGALRPMLDLFPGVRSPTPFVALEGRIGS